MKKILLLGATGRTGKWLLAEALRQQYFVHVLLRDKAKLSFGNANLVVFEETPADPAALRAAMESCEAVVSALNISRHNDFPWSGLRTPVHFLSDTMRNVISLASTTLPFPCQTLLFPVRRTCFCPKFPRASIAPAKVPFMVQWHPLYRALAGPAEHGRG